MTTRCLQLLPVLAFTFYQPLFSQSGQTIAGPEICNNQIDDDGDGYVDCYDPDCGCYADTACTVASLPAKFKMRVAWQSADVGPSVASTPVVGNMNPQQDNMPEIIVAEAMSNVVVGIGFSNKIQFYRGDGSNAANPMVLTIPGTVFNNRPVPGPTIGDVNSDGIPELLITCNDRRIRVYTDYVENPVAPMTLWITSTDQVDLAGQRPALADFDGDGTPEVYVGSDIFKFDFTNPAAPALKKVLNGGANIGHTFWAFGGSMGCNPTAADLLSVADCNGDPDCAGLELAAGPVIYSVDLNPNDGDGYEIKVQRDVYQMVPKTSFSDGYTSVADVDLDGVMDVLVGSAVNGFTGVYIYNKNGYIRFFANPLNTSASGALPCVGNVFDDRTEGFAQDFPEILLGTTGSFAAFNLHAAQKYPATPYWWNVPVASGSGYNPAMTFDFNGDGISEVIYRSLDVNVMYGGAAPFPPGVAANRTWDRIPTQNIVSDEYAVVADVDNDGEAEMVFTNVPGTGQLTDVANLVVAESALTPWVPCRNVWNQYNYFVVNVNDDLTIPAQQQLHHLEIPPGSGQRPLNRYLSQLEPVNGRVPLPDATAQVEQVKCVNNQMQVQLRICNFGAKQLRPGTPITFYATDPRNTNAALFGTQFVIAPAVPKDSCLLLSITLPAPTATVFGVVNDNGTKPRPFNLATNFPSTFELECDYTNNIFQFDFSNTDVPLDLGPDVASCTDTLLTLHAGPGRLSYQWQDNSTDSVFQVKSPGLYWVKVQDPCVGFRTDSVLVQRYGLPQVQVDTVNGDCDGLPASATVLANSAFPPLIYHWSTNDTGATISGVPDGQYSVTVTDAKGCSSVGSSWVEQGGSLDVGYAATNIPCNGQTGSIDLTVTAGTPPFTFNWWNNNTGNSVQNLVAGTYTVTVTDAELCKKVLQIALPEPGALQSAGFSTTGACPGEANGSATFMGATQGTPPYQIKWSTGATTPALSGLAAGAYQLTLTDANGCTTTDAAQVPTVAPPVLDTLVRAVSCFGAADGSVAVAVSSGTPGYGYQWSNNQTSASLQNLSPGAYTLTLTYSDGFCKQVFKFQVPEPMPLASGGIAATPSCGGATNGTAALTSVSQGSPPYSWLWSNDSTASTITGLAVGTYTVTVTDANGCSLSESVQIGVFDAPAVDSVVTPVTCAGRNDGAISISLSGGAPGFDYQWSNGPSTPDNPQLGAGNYTLLLHYADGQCVQQLDFEVTEPPALLSSGITATGACPGEANGTATFLGAAQGTPPYQVQWSTGSTATALPSLVAGAYQLTLTDARGCSLIDAVQVPALAPPLLDTLVQAVSCSGSTDGSVAVAVSGGTPGYGYHWSNGETSAVVQNLSPGTYTLTLTFSNGFCAQVFDFQVGAPLPLLSGGIAATPSCGGGANGMASLTGVSQGTAPYSWLWSNDSTASTVTGLVVGTYTVTVTDANGCSLSESVQIGAFDAPVMDSVVTPVTCAGRTDGAITVSLSGGAPGFGYHWSNGLITPGIQQLGAGIYTLTLTYAGGQCTQQFDFQVTEPQPLLSSGVTASGACPGASNGSAAFLGAAQGTPPYQVQWSTGATAPALTGIPGGTYALTVSDARGCSLVENVQVPEFEAPATNSTVQMISCNGSADGSIAVGLTGGTPGFLYSWSNNATTPDIQHLSPGTYTLSLTFASGACTKTLDFTVAEPQPLISAGIQAMPACPGMSNGTLSFSGAAQGTPPYQLQWSTGSGTPTLTGLAPGAYTLSVTDAHGCTLVESTSVQEYTPPLLDTTTQNIACFGAANGSIFTSVSGGDPVSAFLWSTGETSSGLSKVGPGDYLLTVTYGGGQCILTFGFHLSQPPVLQVGTPQVTPIQCFGAATGSLVLTPSGGSPPYQVLWSNGQNTLALQNLPAGDYTVTLTDANGCSTVAVYPLTQPPALDLSPFSDTITCVQPTATIGIENSAPGLHYTWTAPGGALPDQPVQTVSIAGTYLVTVSNASGCTDTAALVVPENTMTPVADAGASQINVPCQETTALLDAGGSSGGPEFVPHWSRLDGGIPVFDTTALVITTEQPGLYVFTNLNTSNGCMAADTVSVDFVPPVVATVSIDSISCFGANDGGIRLQYLAGGTAPISYSLDNQSFGSSNIFAGLSAGVYPLRVRDADGCQWSSEVVLAEPGPVGVTLAANDTLLDLGQTLILKARPMPPDLVISAIQWQPASGGIVQHAWEQQLTPDGSALYTVQITDHRGCTASDRVYVEIANYRIYTPNTIAPASPGNDVFTVYAGDAIVQVRVLQVYDRWGELVFERRSFAPNDPAVGWDGRFRTSDVQPGVYVWHVELEGKDGRIIQINGAVTVLR